MKSYKVLEAHQGDKAYAVGDTRIADPNAVAHLVKLGLLEEAGDAPEGTLEVSGDVSPEDGGLRDEVTSLRQRVDELTNRLDALTSGDRKDAPEHDYERDNLAALDITKPSTSKDQLLVIAAYEQAEVPEGDDATKAQLIKAIQAKRAAA